MMSSTSKGVIFGIGVVSVLFWAAHSGLGPDASRMVVRSVAIGFVVSLVLLTWSFMNSKLTKFVQGVFWGYIVMILALYFTSSTR